MATTPTTPAAPVAQTYQLTQGRWMNTTKTPPTAVTDQVLLYTLGAMLAQLQVEACAANDGQAIQITDATLALTPDGSTVTAASLSYRTVIVKSFSYTAPPPAPAPIGVTPPTNATSAPDTAPAPASA